MTAESRQFVLPVGLPGGASLDNFCPGPNREAYAQIERALRGCGERFLYLWGGSGSGKSHLLLGAGRRLSECGATAVYLPLRESSRLEPEMLCALERMDLVCIDDIDAVAGAAAWQRGLFHLFNRAAERGTLMLIAARPAPPALPLELTDLASRMTAGLVLRLIPLDDDGRRIALQRRARQRGFTIPDEVATYLLRRRARDMHSLFALLDRLDGATLRARRRVTVPFVKRVLGDD